MPFALDSAIVGIGFIGFGHLAGAKLKRLQEFPLWVGIVGISAGSILAFVNTKVSMRTNQYGLIPIYWIDSVLIICSLINIFGYFAPIITKRQKTLQTFIETVSKQSIIFLCCNQAILFVLGGVKIPGSSKIYTAVWIMARTIITVGVCYIIAIGFEVVKAKCINRNYTART